MISLPRGDIRIGFPPALKRKLAKEKKEQAARRVAMAQGQNWRKHRSNAMGVHFTQVEEYRRFVKENGITGVEYKDNGDCYLSSRHSMKTLVKKLDRVNFDETS